MKKLSNGVYAQPVVDPDINTSVAISGQITVTTAGTEVQGTDIPLDNGVYIKALEANTGNVYVGNNGSGAVSASTGYELAPGGSPIIVNVANLNELWFDSAEDGDKICWLKA